MVKVKENLTGRTFGRLKVLSQAEDYIANNGNHYAQWLCECQCENKTKVLYLGSDLKKNKTPNCGCIRAYKHRKDTKNDYILTSEYGIGKTINTNKEFYFDLEDYDKIKDYLWYERFGYVCTYDLIKIHRVIFDEDFVDHKDRNTFNNRKNNLRKANAKTNSYNRSKSKNNSSGFTGVKFNKHTQKWEAYITFNHKHIFLLSTTDKEQAIKIRLQAEYDLFGPEWAGQRHLFKEYNIPNSQLHQHLKDKGVFENI